MKQIETTALFNLKYTQAEPLLAAHRFPWEALSEIKAFVRALGETLPKGEYEQAYECVWIARDANVFDSVYIAGPCVIGHGAEVRHGAFIRGSALIGAGAVVGNSTELKNCILFDGVQVPHFNYVGDSILGHRAHMGAGAITSNVKSDKKDIVLRVGAETIETGLRKFGAMLGDRVEVGCNSVLNPGTIIGRDSMIYPTSCVRGVLADCSIHKNDGTIVKRMMGEE